MRLVPTHQTDHAVVEVQWPRKNRQPYEESLLQRRHDTVVDRVPDDRVRLRIGCRVSEALQPERLATTLARTDPESSRFAPSRLVARSIHRDRVLQLRRMRCVSRESRGPRWQRSRNGMVRCSRYLLPTASVSPRRRCLARWVRVVDVAGQRLVSVGANGDSAGDRVGSAIAGVPASILSRWTTGLTG